MASIPPFLVNMIKDVPERAFEQVFVALKITEKDCFKSFARKKAVSGSLYGDFVISLFSSDRRVVEQLYKSIEGVLFVGGCAPGFGIAFNIIDACFCFILGKWLSCFVAIISCFPIPGFKIAGKGLEKFLIGILKQLSPTDLANLINKLGRKLSSIGYHSTESYIVIRKQLENFIPGLHNPFAEAVFNELTKIIRRFPVSSKGITDKVCKTGEQLMQKHAISPKLLEVTAKKSLL